MAIGCVLAIVAVMLLRIPMGLSRKSVTAYSASALGIYVAMLCAYWGVKKRERRGKPFVGRVVFQIIWSDLFFERGVTP